MKNWMALLAALGAFSCGGEDEGFTSNDKADLALEDAPRAISNAVCEAVFRCVPLQEMVFESAESCATLFEERFVAASFGLIEDAVEEDRVRYDQEKAQQCLDDLATAECTDIDLRSVGSCADVFVGTVQRGETCTLDEECEGESFCLFGDACPGTCSELLSAGETCVDDGNCESGLVCSEATSRCVRPSSEGDACEQGEPQCASPYICLGADEETGEPGTCLSTTNLLVREEGEACSFIGGEPVLCQEGLACRIEDINLTDGIVSTCHEIATEGDACGVALPPMCPSGYYCAGIDLEGAQFSGSCEPSPKQGDACSDDIFSPCAPGLLCLDGTCTASKENGESCTLGVECLSENCVDGGCAPLSPCE